MEVSGQMSGLHCLKLVLRFHHIRADGDQLAHQFSGAAAGIPEILRCAKDFKLHARTFSVPWDRLSKLSLPAIVELKDGAFIILFWPALPRTRCWSTIWP